MRPRRRRAGKQSARLIGTPRPPWRDPGAVYAASVIPSFVAFAAVAPMIPMTVPRAITFAPVEPVTEPAKVPAPLGLSAGADIRRWRRSCRCARPAPELSTQHCGVGNGWLPESKQGPNFGAMPFPCSTCRIVSAVIFGPHPELAGNKRHDPVSDFGWHV
jgi:hypothetical protein